MDFDIEIANIVSEIKGYAVFDGVVDEEKYSSVSPKILWVLKEANSTNECEAWDMREAIKNLKTETGIRTGWNRTFQKIIYVTNGLINDLNWNDDLYHPSSEPEVIDELQKIAYINVKKTCGGPVSNNDDLAKHYDIFRPVLMKQIETINPDVIIFGGTYWLFENDLNLEQMKNFGSCTAIKKNGKIYISAYHPQYTIKEEVYFNDIIRACRELKE